MLCRAESGVILWRMRCQQHGLSAGPDGACVVCLREQRAKTAATARTWSALFVLAVFGVSAVLLASRFLGASPPPTATVGLTAEPAPKPVAEVERAVSTGGEAPPPSEAPMVAPSGAIAVAEPASSAAAPVPAASAEPRSPARVPDQREVQSALHATPVLMFSTAWCPHCDRARRFFQENGISVVDRDIEADPAALQELKRRTAQKGVPLIVVDGQQLPPGFSEAGVREAVASSVQRRLGVDGLELRAVPN